ncbi:putative secreted protein [Wickerhamomyces ciferrii]|uniref:Secreted protein n=1 Tax=Wickerhamomyces ciferrii (strain ATCC 14091 / BCRC 22168 / CBS 111 / JCM 3599 / NBRC 0793 / NRRL Y-1031 F-60-10) TaxID=1206466 RepID=K0KY80_WICCF|nr:uncharacterized protein BN7_6641 [Wickerhamomyces ciferrii]CCH47032.1 putative secreted protein [Wickerhamomyces ciferrii]
MKLSTIIVPGFLSLSVIALPAATENSINAENSTSLPGNFTDPIIAEAGGERFCFGANKYKYCNGSVQKCVEGRTRGVKDKTKIEDANKICKFFCSEIKTPTQCKQSKLKANYHPKWACDNQKYC